MAPTRATLLRDPNNETEKMWIRFTSQLYHTMQNLLNNATQIEVDPFNL